MKKFNNSKNITGVNWAEKIGENDENRLVLTNKCQVHKMNIIAKFGFGKNNKGGLSEVDIEIDKKAIVGLFFCVKLWFIWQQTSFLI